MRRAAAASSGFCYGCGVYRWAEVSGAGQSRADFVAEHEVCRRSILDKRGRSDNCRCAECKRRKGITDVLSVPPSVRKRGSSSGHSKHRKFVLERDNYVCQVCGLPTYPNARLSDDQYPTLDHIASVAVFGRDDDPENLRTAHRWCNIMLGDGMYADAEAVGAAARTRFSQRSSHTITSDGLGFTG
ncbi:HNH endonuclease [Arthrobacter sp. C152]